MISNKTAYKSLIEEKISDKTKPNNPLPLDKSSTHIVRKIPTNIRNKVGCYDEEEILQNFDYRPEVSAHVSWNAKHVQWKTFPI